MKTSDVIARQQTQKQPAMDQARIPVDAALMTRNAVNSGQSVNWKRTHIGSTRGAAESRPYARDAAIAEHDRRKLYHQILDRALSDAGYARDSYETTSLHHLLDEAMDSEESESESEPEQARDGRRSPPSYITDADYVEEFLDPKQLCSDAFHSLYDQASEGQRDPARRGYWAGLIHFLSSAPTGSRIKDLNQTALSTLLQKVSEA